MNTMARAGQDITPGDPENVRALRPLRVLLAARDRRFARVTSFLLSRRGYEVILSDTGAVLDAVTESRPDIVVLETDPSRASSARLIGALETLPIRPAIVAVAPNGERGTSLGVRTVEKWVSVDELAHEVELASRGRLT
jgi:CheY-like chemotaxis protein